MEHDPGRTTAPKARPEGPLLEGLVMWLLKGIAGIGTAKAKGVGSADKPEVQTGKEEERENGTRDNVETSVAYIRLEPGLEARSVVVERRKTDLEIRNKCINLHCGFTKAEAELAESNRGSGIECSGLSNLSSVYWL